MRPIKFRARCIDGDWKFGDLYQTKKKVAIHVIGDGLWEVDPETVAQFVGYDANGKEVYEGDELTDDRVEFYPNDKVTAILQPYIRHVDTSCTEYFDRFWGKEAIEFWKVKLKEA